jgi:hypothetical protein
MNKRNYVFVTVDGVTRPALVTVDGVKRPAREPPWDSFTDAGIARLIAAPAAACFTRDDGELQ